MSFAIFSLSTHALGKQTSWAHPSNLPLSSCPVANCPIYERLGRMRAKFVAQSPHDGTQLYKGGPCQVTGVVPGWAATRHRVTGACVALFTKYVANFSYRAGMGCLIRFYAFKIACLQCQAPTHSETHSIFGCNCNNKKT